MATRRLVSVKELADELGVSEDSVRRAFSNGKFPGYRVCRMLRFDLTVVKQTIHTIGLGQAARKAAVRVGDSRPRGKRKRPR